MLLTLFAAALACFYVDRLHTALREETSIYMEDLSAQISEVTTYKIKSSFQNLNLTAAMLLHHQDMGPENVVAFLSEESTLGRFTRVIAANNAGLAVDSDGNHLDVSQEPYFNRSQTGESWIAGPYKQPHSDQKSLIYSIPLLDKSGAPAGVLAAFADPVLEKDFLAAQAFGGEGYCQIINSDGSIVLNLNQGNSFEGVKNAFTLWERSKLENGHSVRKIQADMQAGKKGMFRVGLNGTERFVSYQPLGWNDWYLVTEVSAGVVTSKANLLLSIAGVGCAAIIFFFLLFLVLLLYRQKKNRLHLETLAFVDPVTHRPNQNLFFERARRLIASGRQTYAMVSFNVQKFELINDTFGREQGNRTLRHILSTIEEKLEHGELATRCYCDHFLLLLKYSSKEEMEKRLDQLGREINRFNKGKEQKYYLNFSMGVFVIQDSQMALDLIADRANTARKEAKRTAMSVNPCAFYRDIERVRLVQEKDLENRMGAALKNREFLVYLQPKYDLKTNTPKGAEALVRWLDPQKGLIPPSEFVPLFEKNGFIAQLDLYVFDAVCQIIHNWAGQGLEPVRISVNLSRICLNDPDFLNHYEQLLRHYQIPAGTIEFELTEALVYEKMNVLSEVIQRIHALGCTFSLDDFGSGYSSLNMLKEIPVDVLKLDRAFFYIQGKEVGQRGELVVESVVKLARHLGIVTVAEGVEQTAQVAFLKGIGCDMVQGFIFSKPLPVPDFERLVYQRTVWEPEKEPNPIQTTN